MGTIFKIRGTQSHIVISYLEIYRSIHEIIIIIEKRKMKKKRTEANIEAEMAMEFQPVGPFIIKPYRTLRSSYTKTNSWPIVTIR